MQIKDQIRNITDIKIPYPWGQGSFFLIQKGRIIDPDGPNIREETY